MGTSTLVRVVGASLGLVVLLALGLVAWVALTEYRPADVEDVAADCTRAHTPLRAGRPFTLLSWNLQFGAGRALHFWYDGGDAVDVPPEHVERTLAAMRRVLEGLRPDVALLQEVDRHSKRTGDVDELPPLADAMGAACTASAPYHRSPFVPAPLSHPLGRVDMHLAIAARPPLRAARRHQLALLREPWIRRAFNLKRALLEAEVPVEGHPLPLAVAVTHLSAFSYGDGTLERQVEQLRRWIEARPAGQPWVLAGDLNLLPPGDDPARLGDDARYYADEGDPVARLYEVAREAFGDPLAPEHRTYLPFGATEPDRKIDYVFVGGPVRVVEARVLRDAAHSDHLPLVVRLVVGEAAPAEPTGTVE